MKKTQFLKAKMKKKNRVFNLFSIALGIACAATAAAQTNLDRTVLPIQFPKPPALKELYAKDVKTIPPRQEVKAPQGAPGVGRRHLGTLRYPL